MSRTEIIGSSLHLPEKTFFILLFINGSGQIMSTLITVSIQKTREIGLLKSVGFASNRILVVFLLYGLVQGVIGVVLGVGVGLLILKYRNDILQFTGDTLNMELFPKDLYYLNELPAATSAEDVLRIGISVLLICVVASVIPAARSAMLDPVRALRNE